MSTELVMTAELFEELTSVPKFNGRFKGAVIGVKEWPAKEDGGADTISISLRVTEAIQVDKDEPVDGWPIFNAKFKFYQEVSEDWQNTTNGKSLKNLALFAKACGIIVTEKLAPLDLAIQTNGAELQFAVRSYTFTGKDGSEVEMNNVVENFRPV